MKQKPSNTDMKWLKTFQRSKPRQYISLGCIIAIIVCFVFIAFLPPKALFFPIILLISLIVFIATGTGLWSYLFRLSIVFSILFVLMPRFLLIEIVYDVIDTYFSGLLISDYKASFLESLGGMLGTVLAVFGALWADKYLEHEREMEAAAQNARIVYYDFEIVFQQLKEIIEKSCKSCPRNEIVKADDFRNYGDLHKEIHNYRLLIDEHWIRTVASLPEDPFDRNKRKHIYLLYDHLCRIRNAFGMCPQKFDQNDTSELKEAYKEIYNLLIIAPERFRPKFAQTSLDDSNKSKRELSDAVWESLEGSSYISK